MLSIYGIFLSICGRGGVIYTRVEFVSPSDRFNGRKVLVTGGTSGIGLEIAKEFLAEGADVVITGRNEEKLNEVKKVIDSKHLHTIQWDISDVQIVEMKILEVSKLLGGIDIIINNAGIYGSGTWNSITEDLYDKVNDINAKGLFFMCQAEGKFLISQKAGGRIVNINSIAGMKSGFDPYSVSKWGSICITKSIAKILVKYGIIVNGIAPGNVVTNIHEGVRGKNVNDNAYMPMHMTKRYTLVEEIAHLALYLSSDASSNIVGQVITVDGGWTLN